MTADTVEPSGRSRSFFLFAAAAIALIAVGARFWISWRSHSLGEDALITLRYAENIAAGRGWVYNPGERVLGTTTPLFTLLLAALAVLHLPAMPVGIGIDILADGATCFLIARLLARPEIDRPEAGLFAAVLYALSSTPISISISGMETALVTCAGMAAIYACVAGSLPAICLWSAILFLLRIDGLLLFGLLLAGSVVRFRRIPWAGLALFAAVTAPWILFAALYFGSPVPQSVVAKLTVYAASAGASGALQSNAQAFRDQFLQGWPQRVLTFLFAASVLTIVRKLGRVLAAPSQRKPSTGESEVVIEAPNSPALGSAALLFPLVWLLLYYGAMLFSHVPAFPWYFLPPWPVCLAIAALGGDALVRAFGKLFAGRSKPLDTPDSPPPPSTRGYPLGGVPGLGERTGVNSKTPPDLGVGGRSSVGFRSFFPLQPWHVALLLVAAAGLLHVRSIEAEIVSAQVLEDTVRRPLGKWLGERMTPKERVLLEPIGYIGYYSGSRVLDMVGLVSPGVLPYYHTPHPLSGIVTGLRPEWLCLRRNECDRLREQDARWPGEEYDLVKEYPSASAPAFYLYKRRNQGLR